MTPVVATGPGPVWLRRGLVGIAVLYFTGLLKQPPQLPGLHAFTYFTEATALFPDASEFAIEFRLEAVHCGSPDWQLIDPSPLFPIEASSKESRFQRIAHFYQHNQMVMHTLTAWILDHWSEKLGGARIVKVVKPIPPPGSPVPRYEFLPLAPFTHDERRNVYSTSVVERRIRCGGRS